MEHAHIMGRQELHKLGVIEGVPLTAKDGGHLVRDVQDLPGHQGHSGCKHILGRRERGFGEARQERTGQVTPLELGSLQNRAEGQAGSRTSEGSGRPLDPSPLPGPQRLDFFSHIYRVPMGYCLEKHVGFHCRAEPRLWESSAAIACPVFGHGTAGGLPR